MVPYQISCQLHTCHHENLKPYVYDDFLWRNLLKNEHMEDQGGDRRIRLIWK
jgi:hypothetical protein